MDPFGIIESALNEAIAVMQGMIVNEGQETVLNDTFIPNFEKNAQADPSDGWQPVDPQPYQSFMSETVEAGNQIMEQAYMTAKIATSALKAIYKI
jgi:hypothetical protein